MMKLEKLMMVALLLSPGVCWSQCPSGCASNSDSKSTTSLIARSEMQQPQPIPIVKPLRLQEIPPTERSKVHPQSVKAEMPVDNDIREELEIEAVPNDSRAAKSTPSTRSAANGSANLVDTQP